MSELASITRKPEFGALIVVVPTVPLVPGARGLTPLKEATRAIELALSPSTRSAFRLPTFVLELTVIGGLLVDVCRLSAVAPVLVLVLMSFIAGLAMLAVSWVILVAVFAMPRMK